jgi:hypothetical protein
MKKISFAIILGIFAISMMAAGAVYAADEETAKVVLVDNYYDGYHSGDYATFIANLTAWGYTFRNLSTSFAAADLTDVDVIITQAPATFSAINYSTADATAIKTWFETGDKGLWMAGDSDFADTQGLVASEGNQILEAIGANILLEQTSVESEFNSGAAYRVRAGIYNNETTDNDPIPALINSENKYNSSYFHGPTAVIAELDNGTYVPIEGNEAMLGEDYDVFWVCKAGFEADDSTIVPASADGLPYRAHEANDVGNFVLMAVQEIGDSRLVVSGEAIFSDYKVMFGNPNEKGDPNNGMEITKNSIGWLSGNLVPDEGGAGSPGFEVFFAVAALITTTAIFRKRK